MKKILIISLFCLSSVAWAGHLDVIALTPQDDCSPGTYTKIKDDFNKNWGKDYAYQVEIAAPIQSSDMSTVYWLGRSENAAAFGIAADAWIEGTKDPESVAGKLNARLIDCFEPMEERSSYIVN